MTVALDVRHPRPAESVSGAAEDLQQRQQRSDRVEVHDSRRRGGIAVPRVAAPGALRQGAGLEELREQRHGEHGAAGYVRQQRNAGELRTSPYSSSDADLEAELDSPAQPNTCWNIYIGTMDRAPVSVGRLQLK